ncbi:hypothetical protein LX73_1787 [Fodinibius salinus]|uniref:Urease accessory protein UreH-like transmembrane domain-containing protein n=1 Tax=Fodinibius salinus TaxID=860790 RepID=A0A5D3YJV9_9BACT|nr:sulfite exporter TauE/SafE family protein [Fodinibius salinus]TYP94063.1 hypothetical protein LX73_1787 [Fodinibius salinus]
MEWILAGITFGFLGSFHCVGMCGPIALALPQQSNKQTRFFLSRLTYNAGRVVTYTILGVIVGWLSRMVSISGYQQGLSIGMGTVLLLALIWNQFRALLQKMESLPGKFISRGTNLVKRLFSRGGIRSLFVVGILNGLLPCGFVYMALATAITFGAVENSTLFMAGFGMGTIPAMLSISLAGNLIPVSTRQKLKNWSPYFIAIVGIILILRGLRLGIPFISPIL